MALLNCRGMALLTWFTDSSAMASVPLVPVSWDASAPCHDLRCGSLWPEPTGLPAGYPGVLNTESAWFGPDMARKSDEFIYRLSGPEIMELEKGLQHFKSTGRSLSRSLRCMLTLFRFGIGRGPCHTNHVSPAGIRKAARQDLRRHLLRTRFRPGPGPRPPEVCCRGSDPALSWHPNPHRRPTGPTRQEGKHAWFVPTLRHKSLALPFANLAAVHIVADSSTAEKAQHHRHSTSAIVSLPLHLV